MLTAQKKCSLKLLVAMAWADGRVDEEEMEIVEAMLDAYGADGGEAEEIREWAKRPRAFEDVEMVELEEVDVVQALQHAVLLSYIDGEQSAKEVELLDKFVDRLGMSSEAAKPIMDSATAFARSLLPELES
jgi:tellurite resistance protein